MSLSPIGKGETVNTHKMKEKMAVKVDHEKEMGVSFYKCVGCTMWIHPYKETKMWKQIKSCLDNIHYALAMKYGNVPI